MKNSGFDMAAIEVLATNPDLTEKYLKRHRDQTVEQIAALLSDTGPLLDMPAETVLAILALDSARIAPLVKITHLVQSVEMRLELADVKTAMDLAKVMNIMEAESAESPENDGEKMEGPVDLETMYAEVRDAENSEPSVPQHVIARRARERLTSSG